MRIESLPAGRQAAQRFRPTARLLGQSLSRIIPKGFVRGPQIFFGGGKILKQKGWWMGLER